MERAVTLIKKMDTETKQKLNKYEADLEYLKTAWSERIFWEEIDESVSDEDWHKEDKVREMKMKKLMTVAKSKYYMLKINYPRVFEYIESEQADGTVH